MNPLIDSIEPGVRRHRVNSCDGNRLRVEALYHERKARGPKLEREEQ